MPKVSALPLLDVVDGADYLPIVDVSAGVTKHVTRDVFLNGLGAQGPQGPQGLQGDQGLAGAQGDTGPQGPPGDVSGAWPIGSVFISVVSTNPATLLGFGTWAAIAAGRVLVGRDVADTDFDTVEETGGAKTQTPSAHVGTAVDDHAIHTHTYTQVPNHVHGLSTVLRTATTGGATTQVTDVADTSSTADTTRKTDNPDGGVATGTTAGPSVTLTHAVTQPSTHSAMSVVQPYFVVYMWKRTA